jgi:uncharacterized protein (TIGR03435 family)
MTTWIELAGWTLLHFVWQGAIVGLGAWAALLVLRSASPHARYAVACAALAVMLAFPIATAVLIGGSAFGGTRPTGALSHSSDPVFGGSAFGGTRLTGALSYSSDPAPSGSASGGTRPMATPLWAGFRPANVAAGPALEPLLVALVALWLCGVSVLLIRLAAGSWRIRRLQRLSLAEPASRWHSSLMALIRLGHHRAVHVVDSAFVDTPTVIGWLRPVILLPVSAMTSLTPAQVNAILAHELAHIRRHDFLVNVGQTVAETLLFYHPAVWWISSSIRMEREHCCDDAAVEICGDPVLYAEALTELAARTVVRAPFALAVTGGPLIARVRRLLRAPADIRARPRIATAVSVLSVALIVTAGGLRFLLLAQPLPAVRIDPAGAQTIDIGSSRPAVQLPAEEPRRARAWDVSLGPSEAAVRLIGFTARSLIREAYGRPDMPIVDAPSWIDDETFEMSVPMGGVRVGGGTDPDVIRAALREMFERELSLVTHREIRDLSAYALVKARTSGGLGPNIRPSTADCANRLESCGVDDSLTGFTGRHVTMGELAEAMRRISRALDRDVVDRTGLPGVYDFTLRLGFLPIAAIGSTHPALASLLETLGVRSVRSALPEQLGLTLVEATVAREVLVIDAVDRPAAHRQRTTR